MMDGKRLRHILVDKDRSVASLAKSIGIAPCTLGRKLDGKTEFTVSEIVAIRGELELSNNDIQTIFFDEAVS